MRNRAAPTSGALYLVKAHVGDERRMPPCRGLLEISAAIQAALTLLPKRSSVPSLRGTDDFQQVVELWFNRLASVKEAGGHWDRLALPSVRCRICKRKFPVLYTRHVRRYMSSYKSNEGQLRASFSVFHRPVA